MMKPAFLTLQLCLVSSCRAFYAILIPLNLQLGLEAPSLIFG